MPEVSFIIINYNTFKLTCKCIASIVNKVKEVSYEIILVDNASVEVNPDTFLVKFPNIKLIKNDVNLGFAKGNNIGISYSTGDYLCLINSDAEIMKGDFAEAIELFEKGDISFQTGKLIYPDGGIQHNCQPFPSVFKRSIEWLRIHKLMPKNYRSKFMQGFYFDYSSIGRPDWVWGTFMLFEKDLLSIFSQNKLPEDFFMYGEDMDWCYQAKQAGLYPLYNPTFTLIHHLGQSKGSSQPLIQRHTDIFIQKNYNWFHRILLNLCK